MIELSGFQDITTSFNDCQVKPERITVSSEASPLSKPYYCFAGDVDTRCRPEYYGMVGRKCEPKIEASDQYPDPVHQFRQGER